MMSGSVEASLRGLCVVALLSCCVTAGPVFAQDDARGVQALASEAGGLWQAAAVVRDARDRGRIYFLLQLKLAQIRQRFPNSAAATELTFGRVGDIDASVVDRESKSWAAANAPEAENYRRSSAGATAIAVPNFGRPADGALVPRFGSAPTPAPPAADAGGPAGFAPKRLAQVELARKLRESVMLITDPKATFSGTAFFVSSRHLVTNSHVVEEGSRFVIANKTLGIRVARVLFKGKTGDNVGIDAAVLEIEGPPVGSFLTFSDQVDEGETIAISGYPGRAGDEDKAYVQFFRLVSDGKLPTADATPNSKFDSGYVQSIFSDSRTGLENLQNGVNTSGGNSGSPIANVCGQVVALHYAGTQARLDVARSGSGYRAVGDTSKFNYAISAKEVIKFVRSANIPISVSATRCPTG